MTLSRYAITYSPKLGGYAVIYRDSGELVSRHANKRDARAAFKRYKEADERRAVEMVGSEPRYVNPNEQ